MIRVGNRTPTGEHPRPTSRVSGFDVALPSRVAVSGLKPGPVSTDVSAWQWSVPSALLFACRAVFWAVLPCHIVKYANLWVWWAQNLPSN